MKTFYASGKKLSEEITEYFKGGVSYSLANKLIRKKEVKLNGVRVKVDQKTLDGDKIEVYYDGVDERADKIIFKDENILAVYKPSGITSEEFYLLVKSKNQGAGFIHRLDQNTDGIMLFSLNDRAEKELLYGFKHRTFEKFYLAEVYGSPKKVCDQLVAYLKKDAKNSTVKIYDDKSSGGEKIITEYSVLKTNGETSVLEVKLVTGKTHQIRAHLSHEGHFIIGDGKYGDERINRKFHAKKQRLTAYKLILKFDEKSPLYYLNEKQFVLQNELLKHFKF
ncbi:MAG: RluA family pseudouridine synthase [Clostridia bacterium]|nr:RluA family pseudouridine synthase [Clostridia bacterium]